MRISPRSEKEQSPVRARRAQRGPGGPQGLVGGVVHPEDRRLWLALDLLGWLLGAAEELLADSRTEFPHVHSWLVTVPEIEDDIMDCTDTVEAMIRD